VDGSYTADGRQETVIDGLWRMIAEEQRSRDMEKQVSRRRELSAE